ncbi:hypothetical protein GCM10011531_07170 [Aquaticitalea lipolytica]|uniref:7-cyano-7-deazaguanine synthase n=1 Tax=Aquaticitalea lipolytica TaxID=1247562 RepID=A0A8J2TT57_9FLAO|nr:Qat anti-phage system QueC-like protein QatC [Aquaticitalea lipolytica]GFZ79802.1 hypothetical protein GCM10011531_07170 [Aquaticitalea lipolytica]
MKTWNIIIKHDTKDSFDVEISSAEEKLSINTYDIKDQNSILSTNVFKEFDKLNLTPSLMAKDLMHLALSVYTIDQIVSRDRYGFQGWSRHFKINYPVYSLNEWDAVKIKLEKLLSFLSGDKWEIEFRKKVDSNGKQMELISNPNPLKIQKVALFSGGLDSFVGAIDLLENKTKVAFVSHYKRGSEGSVQTKLYSELSNYYGDKAFAFSQFYVQPKQKHKNATKEISSRARSFLFICLGLTVANSLGDDIEFIIPENGLISLNVPLTGTRLSSHSTRTTHPFYISLFIEIIRELGIENEVYNPYQLKTKGEMMAECKNQKILKKLSPTTLSCSHSEISRYAKLPPGIHCGYCVPCIIRRSAEKKSNITGTQYVHDITKSTPHPKKKSGSDIRAFKLALKRLEGKSKESVMFDLLSSGSLPFESKDDLYLYIDTYLRGMDEVNEFLK